MAEPNRASLVVKKDAEVSVTFMAKTDTAYKIEHHKQNILDDNYTLIAADTESKTGATGGKTQLRQSLTKALLQRKFRRLRLLRTVLLL